MHDKKIQKNRCVPQSFHANFPMAMGKPFRLFCVVNVLGDSLDGDDSMQKLARWQHEWRITAEAEAKQAIATGLANSMTEALPKANQMGQCDNGINSEHSLLALDIWQNWSQDPIGNRKACGMLNFLAIKVQTDSLVLVTIVGHRVRGSCFFDVSGIAINVSLICLFDSLTAFHLICVSSSGATS